MLFVSILTAVVLGALLSYVMISSEDHCGEED